MDKIIFNFNFFALICSLFCVNSFAETKENSQVQGQYRALIQIEKKLKEYESKLNNENQRYIQVSKNKKDIELKCLDLEKGLEDARSRYNEKLLMTQKILGQSMLRDMSTEETSVDILQRKLYQKKLVLEIDNLKKQNEVNKELLDSLNTLKNRFQELTKLESEIGIVLNNLEKEKKELAIDYVKQEQENESLKNAVKERKTEVVSSFTARSQILIPIAKYSSVETKSKKGVVVKYDGAQEILCPLDGKVIYTGTLSTYGHVVMIDHGGELRSVILGDSSYSVEKGSSVVRGQKIGIAKKGTEGFGRLYFEIRKNNQVQNTYNVLSSPNALGLFAEVNKQNNLKDKKNIDL